jgi:hypothetical protein
MCLSIALQRPDDILATGEHQGLKWHVIHNGQGYRCGYVRIPAGHPWHSKGYDDIDAQVHGGLTFADADVPCDALGEDNDWWVGFDCAHGFDLPDPSLPNNRPWSPFGSLYTSPLFCAIDYALTAKHAPNAEYEVRSQEYVEAECRKLCEQALQVA